MEKKRIVMMVRLHIVIVGVIKLSLGTNRYSTTIVIKMMEIVSTIILIIIRVSQGELGIGGCRSKRNLVGRLMKNDQSIDQLSEGIPSEFFFRDDHFGERFRTCTHLF